MTVGQPPLEVQPNQGQRSLKSDIAIPAVEGLSQAMTV